MYFPLNDRIVSDDQLIRNLKSLISYEYAYLANSEVKGPVRTVLEDRLHWMIECLINSEIYDTLDHAASNENLGKTGRLSAQRRDERERNGGLTPEDSVMYVDEFERLEQWMFDDNGWK